jgi:biofilm PGA synthesis N-glycosyltransferase PgaC
VFFPYELIGYFVFLYPIFMAVIWMVGSIIFRLKRENQPELVDSPFPFLSIIIPARNEEKFIAETVLNLQDLDYPEYEVIVVNDGSTDRTPQIIDELVSRHSSWLRAVHLEPNSGKSVAMNMGTLVSRGQFILVVDADCLLDKKAPKYLVNHFLIHPRVGAVTGNPRVRNRTTLLGKIQVGEYSNVIGLIKRAQRTFGKILTVSGVIAAYQKSALLDCGFFDSDTVTEDIDITWKMQKRFWDVRYEPRALGWILVPETLKGLWRQRVRWAQGGIEVLRKHTDVWTDRRWRRLWPIYLEYFMGISWAVSLFVLIVVWLLFLLTRGVCYLYLVQKYCPAFTSFFLSLHLASPLIPKWMGAVIAITCLMQFTVSLMIEYKYEKKGIIKYYFWVIWYPFLYWIISAFSVLVGLRNIFLTKKGVTVRWASPDRGILKTPS